MGAIITNLEANGAGNVVYNLTKSHFNEDRFITKAFRLTEQKLWNDVFVKVNVTAYLHFEMAKALERGATNIPSFFVFLVSA